MSLTDRINEDIKAAMLAREKEKLEALRAIKAALLLLKTGEGSTGEITEEAEVKLLQKLVKQRKEAADIYTSQHRADLAGTELSQARVIETYLPAQMPEEELRTIISAVIRDTGASSAREMGKVMGAVNAKVAGKAENKTIAAIVKEMLGV